eukprot:jgi/Mesvir1/883/Mv17449-RA.1
MAFLGGRGAAMEGKYFREEQKAAIARLLKEREAAQQSSPAEDASGKSATSRDSLDAVTGSDVLPEVLRHEVVLDKIDVIQARTTAAHPTPFPTTFAVSGVTRGDSDPGPRVDSRVAALRAAAEAAKLRMDKAQRPLVELPKTNLGPGRWAPEGEAPAPVRPTRRTVPAFASSGTRVVDKQLEAARNDALVKGYLMLMKSFALGTVLAVGTIGGASYWLLHKMDVHSMEELPEKGRQYFRPLIGSFKDTIQPPLAKLQAWAERVFRISDEERKNIGDHFATAFSASGDSKPDRRNC